MCDSGLPSHPESTRASRKNPTGRNKDPYPGVKDDETANEVSNIWGHR